MALPGASIATLWSVSAYPGDPSFFDPARRWHRSSPIPQKGAA